MTWTTAKTVYQEISQGHDIFKLVPLKSQAVLIVQRFNFKGNDQQKIIGELSGGERNRVHLAKLVTNRW